MTNLPVRVYRDTDKDERKIQDTDISLNPRTFYTLLRVARKNTGAKRDYSWNVLEGGTIGSKLIVDSYSKDEFRFMVTNKKQYKFGSTYVPIRIDFISTIPRQIIEKLPRPS